MLELYSFASRIAGAYVIDFLNRRIDDIVVGLVLGPVVLGYFAVASRGVTLVTEVAIRAAQRTALPIFSRLQDDRPRLRAAYYEAIELASCLAIPLFVGMASVAGELCLTLFGQKWAPVIPAMRILGFSGVAIAISAFTPPLLVAIGKPQALFYLSVVEAILGVTTSVVAAHWGLTAVAIGYVARSYLLVPAALVLVGKTMEVRPTDVAKVVVRPAAAALLMTLTVGGVRGLCGGCSAPVRLVLLAAVGAAVYVGTMLTIARPTVGRLLARVQARRAVSGPVSAMAAVADAPAKAAPS
jgi:PST family polysaccharide transporter